MPEKKIDVTITPTGITINPKEKLKLKKNQDNVKWVSDSGQFAIKMPSGHPQPTCRQEGPKWVCVSGTFDRETSSIKYDVTSPAAPTLDPELEVIP
jgi:hypothetical protein